VEDEEGEKRQIAKKPNRKKERKKEKINLPNE
jgi:hypothetical protein